MNREQIVEVVKVHLDGPEDSSLVVDMSDKTVECMGGSGIISWGTYVVIHKCVLREPCECGEYLNEDCEQCSDELNYIVDQVEKEFAKKIDLAEFLEMGSNTIEKQVDKEMEQLGQYANLSDILKYRERFTNRLIEIYDGCDYMTKEDAKEILDNVFVDHSY